MHPVAGRNAISFCNLLFVGNLCACATQVAIYRKSWTRENLWALGAGDWVNLIILAILSGALAPALIYLALEKTTVTNVLLMGRIEPPLMLVLSFLLFKEKLSFLLFKEKVDRWAVIGTFITIIGVSAIFALQTWADPMPLGLG